MLHDTRWTARKIGQRLELIEPLVYRRNHPLPPFRYVELDDPMTDPPVGLDVDDSGWEVLAPDSYWGGWRVNYVMRSAFEVPADWPQDVPVALYLPLGTVGSFSHPESLAYIDGKPYAAGDRHHQEILLPEKWRDGNRHLLALHGWTGGQDGSGTAKPYVRTCTLVQIDQATRDFVAMARVALSSAMVMDDNAPARDRLLNALDDAFKALDTREPFGDAFYDSVPAAHETLKQGIAKAGAPMDVTVIGAGHAHIDVAWLWTLGQTRRKSGRTFHNVLRLMEQFPGYSFTQSQPQLYDYVKTDYPELFEGIKQAVADGRWELIGGMWVEADCNLSGAESLARQFLLGRSFFKEHFGEGVETPALWLPDVFGYSWALPQLIKLAGLEYFFTIKIGWNQYNRMPVDSFWWQGIDGTRILTHFSTTPEERDINTRATYNASASAKVIYGTWHNSQHKESQITHLMSYGWGDGGGGPTREMLENIRELEGFPGMPQARFGRVHDFFKTLEAEAGDSLPTWNGELYLELHRGTYTTQARNKRANRKSEFLLHDAEFLSALADVLDSRYEYPAASLRKAWELVCLNQFHDIIPGSSITPVYTESLEQYEEVREMGAGARDEALAVIADHVGGDVVLANTTGFGRDDLALLPEALPEAQQLAHADGTPVLTQAAEGGGTWISAGELAPFSVTPLALAEAESAVPETGLSVSPTHLENEFLSVDLNEAGDIIRIYDKVSDRDLLPLGGIANQFQAFEDRPLNWDAWDIDIFYDDKMFESDPAESVVVVEEGPLRATLEIKRRILNSAYTQRISLTHNSARLDFQTDITWNERKVLLKVAFPVEVLSPVASYEIQWGKVERPTHRNTSWDWARFETVAQKWVDLSEGGYGVSLLNDCKYGHDIQGNVMRISLLRATTSPDPVADQGQHTFAYSLLPHCGALDEHTVAAAYALNDPIVAVRGTGKKPSADVQATAGMVRIDRPNIVVETIKRAEDGHGVIVRFYESQRRRGPITVSAGFPLSQVKYTNLLEEDQVDLPLNEDGTVTVRVKPFEIVTLRLIPA